MKIAWQDMLKSLAHNEGVEGKPGPGKHANDAELGALVVLWCAARVHRGKAHAGTKRKIRQLEMSNASIGNWACRPQTCSSSMSTFDQCECWRTHNDCAGRNVGDRDVP
jgi:hypothetical protein